MTKINVGETAARDAGFLSPWDVFFWLVTAFMLASFIAALVASQWGSAAFLGVLTLVALFCSVMWHEMENADV